MQAAIFWNTFQKTKGRGRQSRQGTYKGESISTLIPARALDKITPQCSVQAATDHNYCHLANPNSCAKPAPCTFENPAPSLEQIDNEQQANYAWTNISFITQESELKNIPQMLTEVKASPGPEWEKAIEAEMKVLGEIGTRKLEDLPKRWDTIGCKWVFDVKHNHKGKILRYKVRLVAQGYSQIPRIDYFETFVPVVWHNSLSNACNCSHWGPRNLSIGHQGGIPKWRPPRRDLDVKTWEIQWWIWTCLSIVQNTIQT